MSKTQGRVRRLILLVLLAFALGGCQGSPTASRAAVEPTAPRPQLVRHADGTEALVLPPDAVPGLTWTTVKEVELPRVLETSGQVSFDDRRVAAIISRVSGRVEEVRVSQWDTVKRGQPIVNLYSPDYMTGEAEYLQARQTAQLSRAPGFSPDQAQLATSMIDAAKRKLELLGLAPGDIQAIQAPSPTLWMRAPASGTVVEKKVVRGSQVNPGDVLFTIGTLEEVWLTADIYEEDLARVHEGQAVEAVTTAFPTEVFKGMINRASPQLDATTHTAQIRCQIHNPGGKLKPQMLARVRIVTAPGSALVVPQEALVFETGGYYAFVQGDQGTVTRRPVELAAWNEQGYARVLSGLKAGEHVVQGEAVQVDTLWAQAHESSS